MVTYDDILQAFLVYAATREQSAWNKLWFLCEERMAALVKTKAKGLTVPLDSMDLMDLIRDSTARVLRRLREADDVTVDFISKTFYFQNKAQFEEYNRKQDQWNLARRSASLMNEKNFVNFQSP